jgi:hypothetical protein
MNEVEASLLNSDFGDDDVVESQATSIELGDNFVVICNELENGDSFYVVLFNKSLHSEDNFEDDWGNIWYQGGYDSQRGGITGWKAIKA